MWGESENPAKDLEKAIEFTSNHVLYGVYMMKVAREWRYSCENALTDLSLNRKAWIGHAACAYANSIPEDITRKAWGFLTNEQKVLANKQADNAIQWWERVKSKDSKLHIPLESQMLL